MPLRELVLSPIFGKTIEECFVFFMGRKTRHVDSMVDESEERAKYAESSQFLELKSYQLDCCCTEALQAWWDHYADRFGAIEATYKKVFKGCPFRRELGKREKQALLTQIAEDNKLPMIVATNHQTFCPPSEPAFEKGKAASEGSGFATPKALIFVQMKRNLVKEVPSASLVVKAASRLDSTAPLFLASSCKGKRNHTRNF
ncbi:hypothetical protein GBA52_024849 [Prunus armeniaca]|nr:hypothetical protein GBA52_024849 [Prunus armeniaca]